MLLTGRNARVTRTTLMQRSRVLVLLAAAGIAAGMAACGGGGGDDGGTTGPTTGTISGSVSTGTEAVVGATVSLSGGASRTTTTSATGTFSFTALAPGAYSVGVGLPATYTLAAGQTATRNATVVAGQTATVSFTAQRVTGGGGGGGGGGGTVVEVRLSGFTFSPSVVDIQVGTTVRWIVDNGAHTVTPDTPNQAGVWQAVSLSSGQTFEHTFTTAGQNYGYHCVPHQSLGMVGTVRVAP